MSDPAFDGMIFELIGSLVTSELGAGLAGIESYARTYERNGDIKTAEAAREIAAAIKQQRGGLVPKGAPEPETVAAAIASNTGSYVRFWFNGRIYAIDRVRRAYTDTSDVAWLEVEATYSEGCGEEPEYKLVTTIPAAAVEIMSVALT